MISAWVLLIVGLIRVGVRIANVGSNREFIVSLIMIAIACTDLFILHW